MKVAAIINPIAGAGSMGAAFRHLVSISRQAGVEIDCQTTGAPGQARRMAASLASSVSEGRVIRAVIAVGGDGTVHEVADGLTGSPLPLTVWPTGTENLFAKSFGFKAEAHALLNCLQAGRGKLIDVGHADGRSFLIVAGIGFDAEVVHRLVRLRTGHITHLSYSAPLWRTFWEHRFPHLRVYGEQGLLWDGRGLVFVGNMPRYSLGLRVIRDAICDDGLLDLCIFPCGGRLALIGHALRTLARVHVEHGHVRYHRLSRIRIESDEPVPVELDGEAAGRLPLEISVRSRALSVLVPPDPTTV
jgi:diacylglycerol kinase (ATP)